MSINERRRITDVLRTVKVMEVRLRKNWTEVIRRGDSDEAHMDAAHYAKKGRKKKVCTRSSISHV